MWGLGAAELSAGPALPLAAKAAKRATDGTTAGIVCLLGRAGAPHKNVIYSDRHRCMQRSLSQPPVPIH